jgi:hypothetical protein
MRKTGLLLIVGLAGCASSQPVQYTAEEMAYINQMNARLMTPQQPIVYPTMATPQVAPLNYPGGNQVRCIQNGIQTVCRY